MFPYQTTSKFELKGIIQIPSNLQFVSNVFQSGLINSHPSKNIISKSINLIKQSVNEFIDCQSNVPYGKHTHIMGQHKNRVCALYT